MKALMVAAVLAISGLAAGVSMAQDEKKDLTVEQQTEGRLVLETARNLVSYGETKSDPLALVTAAKMMASVPGRVLADGQKGTGGTNFDIDGVLKKAEDLSQGDEMITKIAADVRKSAEANSKAVCYWQYYCYYNGYCEYAYACW